MKDNLDQHLDRKLRESYQAQQAKAPEGLWARLEEQLPDQTDALLDQKLKEGDLQRPVVKAPQALWNSIAEELPNDLPIDAQLDEKVKTSYNIQNQPAPNKVWKAVSRQLNIDKTWERIELALDTRARWNWWALRSLQTIVVAALALLLLRACEQEQHPATPIAVSDAPTVVDNGPKPESVWDTPGDRDQGDDNGADVDLRLIPTGDPAVAQQTPSVEGGEGPKPESVWDTPGDRDQGDDHGADVDLRLIPTGDAAVAQQTPSVAEGEGPKPALVWDTPGDDDQGDDNGADVDLRLVPTGDPAVAQQIPSVVAGGEGPKPALVWDTPGDRDQGEDDGTTVERLLPPAQQPGTAAAFLAQAMEEADQLATNPLAVVEAPQIASTTKPTSIEPITLKNEEQRLTRWSLGVYLALNSTALLNNETRMGFDYNSLTINYFGVAANYGIWGRYQFKPKHALLAEYTINADHKQAYGIYEKGNFRVKEWVMQYNRLGLSYQGALWERHALNGLHSRFLIQAGAYVGLLRSARLMYDGQTVYDRIGEYHNYDIGAKIALGHEIRLDHIVLGYGLRSDIGLTNIFRGNDQQRASENHTNLFHLGGYISLGYQF